LFTWKYLLLRERRVCEATREEKGVEKGWEEWKSVWVVVRCDNSRMFWRELNNLKLSKVIFERAFGKTKSSPQWDMFNSLASESDRRKRLSNNAA